MTSKSKIFAGALGVATVLSLGVAVFTASAQTTFSTNLTVGSTGAQVTVLQQILASKGFLTVAPTGYFGSLTKAAVAAWQASVGLPSTGFFGPLSRAAIGSSMTTTSTPGCSAGSMFNSMTGAPCTGTSSVPGCAAGALFSSTTGAPCNGSTTTPVGTIGGSCPVGYTCTPSTTTSSTSNEGTLTLTLSGTPSNQTNIQQNIDVPVWGLQTQAQIGDVTVQRLDLDVGDTVNASPTYIENPGNFINNIKVWDGSTVLGSWNVNTTSFVQGTTSTDYYIRLSGFQFVVPNGQTKTLTVSFSTNGGIDTSRTLTINGYGSTGLQTSSAGVTDYYNVAGSSFTRTQTFSKPGNTTVIPGIDASNPLSASNYVPTGGTGAQNVPVLVFDLQASNANAVLSSLTVTVNHNDLSGTGAQAASTIQLVQGGTVVASQSMSGTSAVTFNNLSQDQGSTIPSGTNQAYVLEVTVPSFSTTVSSNGKAQVQLTVSGITYQSTTGQVYTLTPNLQSNNQYFFSATPQLSCQPSNGACFTASPVNGTNTNGKSITNSISNTVSFTVTPQGGQMVQPVASDFSLWVGKSITDANASGTAVNNTSITINPVPSGSNPLSQGQSYIVTLAPTINAGLLVASSSGNTPNQQTYYLFLHSASTTVTDPNGNLVTSTQTWGLDNFKSNPFTVSE